MGILLGRPVPIRSFCNGSYNIIRHKQHGKTAINPIPIQTSGNLDLIYTHIFGSQGDNSNEIFFVIYLF